MRGFEMSDVQPAALHHTPKFTSNVAPTALRDAVYHDETGQARGYRAQQFSQMFLRAVSAFLLILSTVR